MERFRPSTVIGRPFLGNISRVMNINGYESYLYVSSSL
jgi:hypothetical protein